VYIQALQQPRHPNHHEYQTSLNQLMHMLRTMQVKSPYTASLLMQLEQDFVAFGKANPIGHIVVSTEEISQIT